MIHEMPSEYVYGLLVDGTFAVSGYDPEFLMSLAPAGGRAQVVLMVSPTGAEREYYSINAYVAECGEVSPVDVSMNFNLSLGAAIKRLATLEQKGFVQSTLTVGAFGKQVRRYSPRVA